MVRGRRGPKGEKGETGGDSVFIKVSNQEVYAQIKNLQCTNDAGHATILDKIEALDKKMSEKIETFEQEYHVEHEKLKGQVALSGLSMGGIGAILVALIWIVLSHLGIKP
jgi:uncharacterized protein YdcH (DUF465 family)